MEVVCTNCHQPYPDVGVPYRCPTCGGIYDYLGVIPFSRVAIQPDQPGIWRYRETFGLPRELQPISLGEGNTPLIWDKAFNRSIAFKCEYLNPSGSFKDRGSATLVGFLRSRQVEVAVEDSSGNAGASFAAYAARAGIKARVFVPEMAAGPKRVQISAYGAEVEAVAGPRSNATEAVRREAEHGVVYASHAYLPFNIPGYATLAYELLEQLGKAPGTVVLPVGQGGLLLGLLRGFEGLLQAGEIRAIPKMIGVQARLCAPLWAASSYGLAGLQWVSEGPTKAEGIRVVHPLRGDTLIRAMEVTGGQFLAVEENDIMNGRDQLARRGLYVEITSAVVWNALFQVIGQALDPLVVVLTGSGLKNP